MERNTRQRDAIRSVIAEAHGPVSAREVLDLAQRRVRGMGMATVYRTLKSLVADRGIVQVEMPGEPPRYEIAGKGHHHHFYCRACGRMYEVEQCPGDLSYLAPKGFKLENHDLLLLGLCASCIGGPKASKAEPKAETKPGSKTRRTTRGKASPAAHDHSNTHAHPHAHPHPHPHPHPHAQHRP
ncbi:MAG: transcriptional repressor [Planctomycetes bacterium]|nr:transcriptional repressor [Planctomycetota bacterium]